jgi:tripartite-type tricarboxylate transporter receptor subunit TctC
VPYKGTAPALADLLAGQVDMMCDNLGVSLPHVKAGRLRALAVTSKSAYLGIPAMAETLPGFEAEAWFGIVGPPKMSSAIAAKVGAAVREILQMPDVSKRLGDLSARPMGLGPAEMAAFMKEETERWAAVIRTAGVKID